MQAKDIPDEYLIELVKRLSDGFPYVYRHLSYWDNPEGTEHGVDGFLMSRASLYSIESAWGTVPPKVIRAKLRGLIRKGKITGCACGCRGDFKVVETKREED